MILSGYRALSAALQPAGSLLLKRRMRRGKEDPDRISERLGHTSLERPAGPLVWLHAASVGESQSILRVIERLTGVKPPLSVLVTTGTVTSAGMLKDRMPEGALHQYSPIDLPAATRRFIAHWRPDLAIWTESELWPNLIGDMAATGKPLALINGRMSARSFGRWRRFPGAASDLLGCFALILAQNDEAAERFRQLGAVEVRCEGNLKYAAEPLPVDPDMAKGLGNAVAGRPAWLASSVHPGEDAVIGDVHRTVMRQHPGLLSIVAPRHPARAPAMAATFGGMGLSVTQRSLGEEPGRADVYLADTMGELGTLYSQEMPVFVGGSLIPHGGQNMLEPARFGRCVLTGPHTTNFTDVIDDMKSADALIEVENAEELAAAISRLIGHRDEAATLGERARSVAIRQNAVLERVMSRLEPLIPAS